jgi:undecaprenyl-diphosphatase
MDRSLFLYLNGLATQLPGLGEIAAIVAQDAVVLYAVLLIALWWRGGRGRVGDPPRETRRRLPPAVSDTRRHILLLAVLAAGVALSINLILNWAVPRPRPSATLPAHLLVSEPHDPSFPSDHAAVTSAIGTVLLLGGEPAWGVLGIVGAVLIGAARVAAGVHYPSDILGGILVGGSCGIAAVRARELLSPMLNFILKTARALHLA